MDCLGFLRAQGAPPDADIVNEGVRDAGTTVIGVSAATVLADVDAVAEIIGIDGLDGWIGAHIDQVSIDISAADAPSSKREHNIVPIIISHQRNCAGGEIEAISPADCSGEVDSDIFIRLSEDAPAAITAGIPVFVRDERRIV